MVGDIAERLLLDNMADEAAILQTVRGKLSPEEYQLVSRALDQMEQRSRHIATQLCVVTSETTKETRSPGSRLAPAVFFYVSPV